MTGDRTGESFSFGLSRSVGRFDSVGRFKVSRRAREMANRSFVERVGPIGRCTRRRRKSPSSGSTSTDSLPTVAYAWSSGRAQEGKGTGVWEKHEGLERPLEVEKRPGGGKAGD